MFLVLCANLIRPKDAPIAGYTLFLDMFVKLFLEEVNIGIGGLTKEDGPPQCGWASFYTLKH